MIDRNNVLDVAGRYMSNLEEVTKNVFKGRLNIGNKTAGVYFFDLNNQPIGDFDAYQEALLAKEFYSVPGNLQWNYYLFLLNDQLKLEEKDKIERNDKYARKYVLNENEFADYFIVEKSDAGIKPNIVADWKLRLDQSGLKGLYGTTSIAELLRRFKTSQTEDKKGTTPTAPASNVEKISFINRLELANNYRKYPLQRNFHFGNVNLFRGINGVGKTSLFEAIEAMICGKCLRNPTLAMPLGSIQAEFNGSGKLTAYDAKDNKLFQARDFDWYATNTNRGSNLYNSFNRFNFFNADAAQSFSNANTEAAASEALYSIILGPEYHHISERCVSALNQWRPEYNRLDEDFKKAKRKGDNANVIIKNYKEPKSIGVLRSAIFELCKNLNFKSSEPVLEIPIIEERNNRLLGILSPVISDLKYSTQANFKTAEKAFEEEKKELDIKEQTLRLLTDQLSELSNKEARLNRLSQLINRSILYIQDEKAMQLVDMEQRQNAINLLASRLKLVANSMTGLNIQPSDKSIPETINQLTKEVSDLNGVIAIDEKEISTILESFSKISGIIKQIKVHGREFLSLNTDDCDCPLCQASYSRDELSRRILLEDTARIDDGAALFNKLTLQIEGNKLSVSVKDATIQELRKLQLAYETAFSNKEIPSPTVAVNEIKSFQSENSGLDDEQRTLANVKEYASTLNFSEKELRDLKTAIADQWGDEVKFEFGQSYEFTQLLARNADLISDCKKDQTSTTEKRTAIGNEIKKIVGADPNLSLQLKDIKDIIQRQANDFDRWNAVFKGLNDLITLEDHTSLNGIFETCTALQNNLSSIRQEQQVQFEYETAIKDRDEATKFIDENSNLLSRFQKAVETLRSLTGDEAIAHVTAFFDENFAEIIDIFKSIHVPKEFTHLTFKDGKLELTTDKGEKRTISQISTGQRSALALSIFLTLNSKLKNGPDIIMFDDPVAFIDDLNALSFLDHLRMHVLKNNKQIFFATANMRLAGLFERKFNFMDSGFKKFDFNRPKAE